MALGQAMTLHYAKSRKVKESDVEKCLEKVVNSNRLGFQENTSFAQPKIARKIIYDGSNALRKLNSSRSGATRGEDALVAELMRKAIEHVPMLFRTNYDSGLFELGILFNSHLTQAYYTAEDTEKAFELTDGARMLYPIMVV